MCGILGIVAPDGKSPGVDQSQIITMRDKMTTRGPDDSGLFLKQNVAFAHRRLAIRDFAGGKQPWISDDGQCVLVYNGEIYNDGELRQELIQKGHQFRTRSDTEVVMAAYQEWGKESLSKLNGMFAFGIYDFRNRSLLLARDRFGIKPLFLSEVQQSIVFASSISAILQHPEIVKAPNFSVISHYLTTFRITLGRETVYRGIWQLMPGELLEFKSGNVHIEKYWDYPEAHDNSANYKETAAELESGLSESVRKRLVSDVPVGMFVSGGVDSNVLACLVRNETTAPMIGQCGGGTGDSSDDFKFAQRCAKHVQFDYGEVRVAADDYLDHWQQLLDQYETPVSTPSDVVIFRIAQELKQHVGVALGGEGADELLCGYAVQQWSGEDYDRRLKIDSGEWSPGPKATRLFQQSLMRQYGRDHFQSEVDHYFALSSLIPSAVKPALFNPDVWQAAAEDQPMLDYYRDQFAVRESEPTCVRLKRILHKTNLEALLARLDSATMQASLEARVPYTDHHIVEKMFQAPMNFKIDIDHLEQAPYLASGELQQRESLRSKRVLRSVAERLMPAELAQRKKASFPTPVQQWLGNDWSEWAAQTLSESPFAQAVFQPAALAELTENPGQSGMWLWPILNVACWGDRAFAA